MNPVVEYVKADEEEGDGANSMFFLHDVESVSRNSIRLKFCYVVTCPRAHPVPMHRHDSLELIYFLEGRGCVQCGTQAYDVCRGCFLIIPAVVQHNQINLTDLTSICIGVSGSGLDEMQGCWFDGGGVLGKVMRLLSRELATKGFCYERLSHGLVCEAVAFAGRLTRQTKQSSKKSALVQQAKEMIQREEGELSVTELAGRLGVSRDYLRHLFLEYSGQSPIRHIMCARIEKAKDLLAQKGMSIGEIALRCGIGSAYYFSRFFRKITGMTPTQFRRMYSSRP